LQNIKGNEEIFQNNDDLSKQIQDIHLEYFSEEKTLENKNSEIPIGIQSEKNCCVLVTPTMVQSTAPLCSQEIETASPVSYFESLTPDLRDSDNEWNYKSIEGLSSNDERSDENSPLSIFFGPTSLPLKDFNGIEFKGDMNLYSQDVNDRSSICNNKNNWKASEKVVVYP
jgi:hypothetical protein